MNPKQPRKCTMWYLTAIIILMGLTALRLLGWMSERKPWTVTTGWDQLPDVLRPSENVSLDDEPWIRWLGHSGFLIHWHGTTILLDPNRSDHCTVSKRIMEIPPTLETLGPVHVLISHAHYDHLHQDTLTELVTLESILIPAGSETFLDQIDQTITQIIPATTGTTYTVGNLRVTPVFAAHNGNRFHPLRSQYSAVGYMIQSPLGITLYYAGDTADHLGWQALKNHFHPDIAIVPIGAYAPRIPLKYHHLNPEEAVSVALKLGVKKVIPCHFGTFTLSFDRPAYALPRFARAAKLHQVPWSMPEFLTSADLTAMNKSLEGKVTHASRTTF